MQPLSILDVQLLQSFNDLLRLQTHGHHSLEQLQRVLGVAHGFDGPVVGVVDDAAVLVGLYTLALRAQPCRRPRSPKPSNRRFAEIPTETRYCTSVV